MREFDPERFGELLRAIRGNRSQSEISTRSGVPVHQISRYEKGQIEKPSFEDIVRLSLAYGLTPNDLAELAGLYVSEQAEEHVFEMPVLQMLRELRNYLTHADERERFHVTDVINTLLQVRRVQLSTQVEDRNNVLPPHIREKLSSISDKEE